MTILFRTVCAAVVCAVTAGCASTDINSPANDISCKDPLTSIDIWLQPIDSLRDSTGVLRQVPQYLLLSDSMSFDADLLTIQYPENPDFDWQVGTPALAFTGPPTVKPWSSVLVSGRSSHVVVRGVAPGSSTVTATCGSRSHSARVDVVSPTRLQTLTLNRERDSAKVGDTLGVFPVVRDIDSHSVNATVVLTTTDPNVAVSAIVPLTCCPYDSIQAIIAKVPGTVTVSGAVAGLRSSFQLRVKR